MAQIDPALEKALTDTLEQYKQSQEAAAAEEKQGRRLVARVDLARRYPDATIQTLEEMATALPRAAFTQLTALYRSLPGVLHVVLSPDESTQTALGGHALVLQPTQEISQLAHIVNVKSPFGLTFAVRVRNVQFTSTRNFHERYKKRIEDFVRNMSNEGPALATHWAAGSVEDSARWPIFFPTKRAHIGCYKTKEGMLYIIMRTHAGRNILDGVNAVVSEPGMTVKKFISDPRVKWMHSIAYRNAARVVAHLAKALDFSVPETYDYKAYTGPERAVKYRCAVPDISFSHDTHRLTSLFGKEHAVISRDYIDGTNTTGNYILVHADVTDGYVMLSRDSYAGETMPLFAMTTGKIPAADRQLFTPDERDERLSRVVTQFPRTETLTALKFRRPRSTDLVPVVVVRA